MTISVLSFCLVIVGLVAAFASLWKKPVGSRIAAVVWGLTSVISVAGGVTYHQDFMIYTGLVSALNSLLFLLAGRLRKVA